MTFRQAIYCLRCRVTMVLDDEGRDMLKRRGLPWCPGGCGVRCVEAWELETKKENAK